MDKVILSIDTASKISSVTLLKNGEYFFEESQGEGSNNEELSLFIDNVLLKSNTKISDVDVILVNQGPGSFTGLRIGYAYITGIASSLDIPICEISFLESYSKLCEEKNNLVCMKMKKDNFFVYDNNTGKLEYMLEGELKNMISSSKVYLIKNYDDKEIDFEYEEISTHPSKILIEYYLKNKIEPTNILSLSPNYIQKISAKKISERQ